MARLAPVALFAFVVAVYLPSLPNAFVYDDHEMIERPAPPAEAEGWLRLFAEPHFRGLPYYRPLTRASLLAEKSLRGGGPAAYRLTNALLMGAAALLAWALLRTPGFGVAPRFAALAAALFAVHPVASGCVYPIASGRETLLPAVLVLAAVLAFARGRRALAWAAAALALLAKEQAVVVPLLFAALDAAGLVPERPRAPRGWLLRYLPAVPLLAAWAALRLALFGGAELQLAVLEAPLHPVLSYAYALQVSLAPFVELVYEPELGVWWAPARLAAALLAAAALVAAARQIGGPAPRVLGFWLAWFVVAQLPTANWLQQEARFDERYAFLALLALPAVAAGAACALGPRGRRVATAAGLALIAAAAAVTLQRAPSFRNDRAFAEQWLRTDAAAPEAHHALALDDAARGDLEGALAHFRAALPAIPGSPDLRVNLATVLARLGRGSEAELELREALRLAPEHPEAHTNLAALLSARGQLAEAERHARAALRAAPDLADAHNTLAVALLRQGRSAEAVRHLERALALAPGHEGATRNLDALRAR